ncbi:uncharacterized protein EI97DRAFT_498195 [Westerdykella ornata]|uniref:Uncharacterized protein n=1 Tax=Westerdykella ornata TaxID=318751 RepID=A0A6A6JTG8_WESOR|nr:uncharacterized protein EI97DRAFT_498195 [Westerdykella ornata]KAF2279862.1 hypothetical protein EI97DRAFT_498195 [Westerdykella ornata]
MDCVPLHVQRIYLSLSNQCPYHQKVLQALRRGQSNQGRPRQRVSGRIRLSATTPHRPSGRLLGRTTEFRIRARWGRDPKWHGFKRSLGVGGKRVLEAGSPVHHVRTVQDSQREQAQGLEGQVETTLFGDWVADRDMNVKVDYAIHCEDSRDAAEIFALCTLPEVVADAPPAEVDAVHGSSQQRKVKMYVLRRSSPDNRSPAEETVSAKLGEMIMRIAESRYFPV